MNKDNFDPPQIIDIHAHLGSYFQFPIRQNSVNEIMETAQSLGIKKMCVSHMYSFQYDAKKGNDLTLEASEQFPDFFLPGGVLDPRWNESELESEFSRIESKAAMWNELHPALHQYPISGKGYRNILDLIRKNPKPALFHTDESDQYSKPKELNDLIKLYPEIPFIIGHSGNVLGGFEISSEIVKKNDNAFLDSAFSRNYFGLMKWMIEKVGAEKILFGSDIPFLNGAAQIGKFYEPGISEKDRQRIFHDNAKNLLEKK